LRPWFRGQVRGQVPCSARTGSDPHRLLVAEVETEDTSIKPGGERPVYDRIFERLRVLPGVNSLSGTNVVPLMFKGFEKRRLDIPGFEDPLTAIRAD
jgi:hypothetical protein